MTTTVTATQPSHRPVLVGGRWRPGQPVRTPKPGRQIVIGVVASLLIVAYALVVPVLHPVDPTWVDFERAARPPSAEFWFGTDAAGRDLFSRTASGLRISLLIAVVSALSAAVIGALVGVLSAALGGIVDTIVMRLVDSINALPHLVLGIVIVAFFRGSVTALIIAIALTHWTQVARIVRACVLPLRGSDFVAASVNAGYSRWQIIRAHYLPAVVPQVAISLTLLTPHAVWHESTLSFLGVGLAPHEPSIGVLLQMGQAALITGQWWMLLFPALALIGTTLAFAATGRGLRNRLNTRGVAI